MLMFLWLASTTAGLQLQTSVCSICVPIKRVLSCHFLSISSSHPTFFSLGACFAVPHEHITAFSPNQLLLNCSEHTRWERTIRFRPKTQTCNYVHVKVDALWLVLLGGKKRKKKLPSESVEYTEIAEHWSDLG